MIVYPVCIIAALLAIAFSGFYSGSETGLYCLNRLRLKLRADKGDLQATRLERIVADEPTALTTLLVGTNLANYLATVFVAYLLTRATDLGSGGSEVYTTAIVTPIIFVFGEIVPKNLFQRHADYLMYPGGAIFRASEILFKIPTTILRWITKPLNMLVDPAGLADAADPRRRIATLLQEAVAHEDIEGHRSAIIDRVLSLPNIVVHQVMVPRNQVVTIRNDATRKKLLSTIRKNEFSRLCVFERHQNRIIGYVNVHELLVDTNWSTVQSKLRHVVSLDPHESVAGALIQLQSARETIATVVDRNGHLLGLVTLKDLLEELTGELHEW